MKRDFQIVVEKSEGQLQVIPKGNLDGVAAWELASLIGDHCHGDNLVVVDTQYIDELSPLGCDTFRCRLSLDRLPASQLSFIGIKGAELAPRGCKVISAAHEDGCHCGGNCRNCRCREKKSH